MNELLKEYLLILFWYIVPCFVLGLVVLFVRFVIKPKDYIYRKILHISAILTVFCFILPSHTWWIVVLDILTILFLINVTLFILERFKLYKMLFVDKSHHEILRMINAYYLIMVVLVLIFYGLRGEENKYLVITSILSWGLGDALAAIIGIRFGKNKLNMNFVDEKKTIEGSVAMLFTCFLTCLFTLLIFTNFPIWKYTVTSILIATSLTYIEAISKKGMDNILCPLTASIILLVFSL